VDPTDAFVEFAGLCFRHKRKTIRNNLSGHYSPEALACLPEASLRAEAIPLERLAAMYISLGRA
jgi:16S rRNA A1518/A1519 N6-dimethyltransferase RsmA/KsgA/DIM1 with predicted DNA glycosylase/AP lyase activity